MEWSVILLSTHFHLPPAQLLKFHPGSNWALAVFAPSFRHVLFSLRREIEGKCGPRSLDRIWSKEQRWQDHIFLAGVRLGLYLMSRQDSHYEPSVIGWKTAQLLNKVGSNEDLYRLTRDDIHRAEAGWLHDHEFLMTLRSSDSVSLHPASLQMSDQVLTPETNTNNRKLDCSDQCPGLFVRPQSGDR